MKKGTIIGLSIVALIIIGIIYVVSIANTCVGYETNIEKANEQMANIRGRVKNVLSGMGDAADEYTTKVTEAFEHANESRYGATGSQAAMQWFKEQNPNIDPKIYLKVQEAIEAQWTDFSNTQTPAIDVTFNYKNYLRRIPAGTIAGWMGYPKVDMKKFEKAVTTKDARHAIETREDDGVDAFERSHKEKAKKDTTGK